ncbi:MAG: ribonuclease P protein component [Deltaproteobacteria bacterium]|nr:ribonuclease P protein component [Deltaproteobacteria bacterium]MCL5791956.1 ribonuclease P protein component [Deltaproteobacteria bacterium]
MKKNGKKLYTYNFIILYRKNDLPLPRFGIIISKKVGNAVKRNRLKRLIREFFRTNKDKIAVRDYVFIAKKGSDKINYNDINNELSKLFTKAK